jgi:hypothetical protein
MGASKRGNSPSFMFPIVTMMLTKQLSGEKSCLPCLYLPAKLNYFRKMYENRFGARSEQPPLINLLVIILMVGLGFVIVGPFIGFFAALPFSDNGGLEELLTALQQPLEDPGLKIPIYIIQAFATFV